MDPNLIRQFNRLRNTGAHKSLVQKAILSAQTGSAEALIAQHLEKVITTLVARLSPEIAMVVPRYDPQKSHEFNRLTALPAAGGAMGESGTTPSRAATYVRDHVDMKIVRRKGGVTGFLQDTSKKLGDASAMEMENHLQSHVYDLIAYVGFGSKAANPFQYDGLDALVTTNRGNEAQGGAVPTDLTLLDTMIDANVEKQGGNHRRAFLMSPQMLSKYSRLLTNVRLNQGVTGNGLSVIDIPGGWRLAAYRDIPIIQSALCRNKVVMGTITPATATSGGTIPDGTYYIRVSAITWYGETQASAQATQVAGGGNTSTITLSWTAVPGALLYKVYCSTTTGQTLLRKRLPATLFDDEGTPGAAVTSVRFTTNPAAAEPTVDQLNGAAVPTALGTLANTVPAAHLTDIPLGGTADNPLEIIAFWDLDEFQGMGKLPYTNSAGSRFNGLVTLEPLAKTDDNLPFLVKTYCALCPSWEATSWIQRGLKVA